MKKLNQELPITADKKVFSKLGFNTQFNGSNSKIEIKQLTMALDQTNLNGDFSVVNFSRPAIKFGIDIDQINVDRYLPPAADDQNRKPLTPETAAGAAVQLPVETLQTLNVLGKLSIGKLTISNVKLRNVKLKLKANDGKIRLDPIAANLYRGSYSGNIRINANGKLPKLVINSAIKGVPDRTIIKGHDG